MDCWGLEAAGAEMVAEARVAAAAAEMVAAAAGTAKMEAVAAASGREGCGHGKPASVDSAPGARQERDGA